MRAAARERGRRWRSSTFPSPERRRPGASSCDPRRGICGSDFHYFMATWARRPTTISTAHPGARVLRDRRGRRSGLPARARLGPASRGLARDRLRILPRLRARARQRVRADPPDRHPPRWRTAGARLHPGHPGLPGDGHGCAARHSSSPCRSRCARSCAVASRRATRAGVGAEHRTGHCDRSARPGRARLTVDRIARGSSAEGRRARPRAVGAGRPSRRARADGEAAGSRGRGRGDRRAGTDAGGGRAVAQTARGVVVGLSTHEVPLRPGHAAGSASSTCSASAPPAPRTSRRLSPSSRAAAPGSSPDHTRVRARGSTRPRSPSQSTTRRGDEGAGARRMSVDPAAVERAPLRRPRQARRRRGGRRRCLGLAAAEVLAECGARVTHADIRAERLAEAAPRLRRECDVRTAVVDVTDDSSVRSAFADAAAGYGSMDLRLRERRDRRGAWLCESRRAGLHTVRGRHPGGACSTSTSTASSRQFRAAAGVG